MSNKQKGWLKAGFTTLPDGVIRVAHSFSDLIEPWCKIDIPDYLARIDHSLAIADRDAYEKELKALEVEFNLLVRQLVDAEMSLIVVFQGRDGSGKTGATMRITEAVGFDFKLFQSVPIGPPSQEELDHGYLWRFGRYERMPAFGQVRVLDRSWAERVLVERVMKLTNKKAIRASYAEIRAHEWLLARQGAVVVKLWLDITKGEQKKRFKARRADKPWKVSDSDAIARAHWNDYTPAANELFHRTGTDFAPWFLISSEDKRYSRIVVLRVLNEQMRQALNQS